MAECNHCAAVSTRSGAGKHKSEKPPPLGIVFKGTTKAIRLSDLSVKEEMWLENGRPHEYVYLPESDEEDDKNDQPCLQCNTGGDWDELAGEEIQAFASHQERIAEAEADKDSESSTLSLPGLDPEEDVGERVRRYQASLDRQKNKQGATANVLGGTYWVEPFMRIVEELKLCPEPTETEGFSGFSFNKGMDLLSGCTGMGAEAWLLGIPVSRYNCSDPKSESFHIVNENFRYDAIGIHRFHKNLQEQMAEMCDPTHSDAPKVEQLMEDPDMAIIGTPCQPFSKQRTKRSVEGSVRGHSKFDTTFVDLIAWLATFEPKCGCCEQVEGLDRPESASNKTTPMERRNSENSCFFFCFNDLQKRVPNRPNMSWRVLQLA
ncbi:Uncharacterized protein SCF082_LOCUS11820 [Durusdinium trenchii]|uniref:DNA (cytosine-5-)-methyltransferase n=1 Tax=Durusdinium trenchii TaxID=1381693 RepID=A0ABP0JFJ5_9DINO